MNANPVEKAVPVPMIAPINDGRCKKKIFLNLHLILSNIFNK